jgi:hypothetical protein
VGCFDSTTLLYDARERALQLTTFAIRLPSMQAGKTWVVCGAVVLVASLGWIALSPKTREPAFLRDYPLLDTSQLSPENSLKKNTRTEGPIWLLGQPQGSRIYTFRGDFHEVVEKAKSEPGWQMKKLLPRAALFTRKGETLIIRATRSLVMKWPGTTEPNRYLVSEEEAARSKIKEDVKGWVSVDHDWQARPGLISGLLK